MILPFTHDAFLDVFAAFNRECWPAVVALWIATAWTAWRWRRDADTAATLRLAFGVLALHWLWSGVVYHWVHFRRINPAAIAFGTAFVLQGVAFATLAVVPPRLRRTPDRVRTAAGDTLVLYGLAYPIVGLLAGLTYPAMPVFAVPCPTTLVTTGWLSQSDGVPRWLLVIPLLWALVGASAAFVLGIRADVALLAAAAVLVITGRRRRQATLA